MKRAVLLISLGFVLAGAVFLAETIHRDLIATPIRYLDITAWMLQEARNATPLAVDDEIGRLIHRAEEDYRIAPIPERKGKLIFSSAHAVGPNDVYLVFGIEGEAHDAIVYRFAREDGRPLWKAIWAQGS
jgi:hypothetical protein